MTEKWESSARRREVTERREEERVDKDGVNSKDCYLNSQDPKDESE